MRQPYALQLWICDLKIMNLKHTNGYQKILCTIRVIDFLSIPLETEVSKQSGLTKMAAVNFLASKMNKTSSMQSFFLDQWGRPMNTELKQSRQRHNNKFEFFKKWKTVLFFRRKRFEARGIKHTLTEKDHLGDFFFCMPCTCAFSFLYISLPFWSFPGREIFNFFLLSPNCSYQFDSRMLNRVHFVSIMTWNNWEMIAVVDVVLT